MSLGPSRRVPFVPFLICAVAAAMLILHQVPVVTSSNLSWKNYLYGMFVGCVLYFITVRRGIKIDIRYACRLISCIAFFCGASEEIIFRGWIIGYWASIWGVLPAVCFSVSAFAWLHRYSQGIHGFVIHLLTGLAFTAAYLWFGGLSAAISAHVCYNLLVLSEKHNDSAGLCCMNAAVPSKIDN